MKCQDCGQKTTITNTYRVWFGQNRILRRRRRCLNCQKVDYTYELWEEVIKSTQVLPDLRTMFRDRTGFESPVTQSEETQHNSGSSG